MRSRYTGQSILIVGMSPGARTPIGRPALDPHGRGSGRRLVILSGIPIREFVTVFRRVNLLTDRAVGVARVGRGDRLVADIARSRAREIADAARGRSLLLAGQQVARAFGHSGRLYRFEAVMGVRAATIPHPSGLNRYWNDPRNRNRFSTFMSVVAEETRKYGDQ